VFIIPKLLSLRTQIVFINFYERPEVSDFNYESRSEVLCANRVQTHYQLRAYYLTLSASSKFINDYV